VDQADIQTEIDRFLAENEQLKEVLDRKKVQKGDTVSLDYTITLDGSELTDKKAEDLTAEIGTGTLPGSIEDGLVGKEKGSTTEFKVTLPQDYQDKDLAGKEAVYKVTVNSIYTYKIPELSDKFLADLGRKDDEGKPIDTVDRLKDYFRKQLEAKAQAEHDEAVNTVILNYLMENSTFTQEIPGEFTDRMEAAYKKMYREYAGLYGEDLPTFMARIGSTQETYEEDIKKIAEQYSRQVLILQAIGEKENLLPTEKEMQDYAEKTAASFGYESAQDYEKDFPIELVYDNLICDKVLAYLRGNVKPVSEEKAPEGEQ
jgi:trigger factor